MKRTTLHSVRKPATGKRVGRTFPFLKVVQMLKVVPIMPLVQPDQSAQSVQVTS